MLPVPLLMATALAAPPAPIDTPAPIWPRAATVGLGGVISRCAASLDVAPDGSVVAVRMDDCLPVLSEPTREALARWRFAPLDGADTVVVPVVVRFRGPSAAPIDPGGPPDADAPIPTAATRPAYPGEARARGGADMDFRCDAVLSVRADGRTEAVDISGCPEAYAREARRAALRWAFHPLDPPKALRVHLPFVFAGVDDDSVVGTTPPPTPDLVLAHQVPPDLPPAARALGSGTLHTCSAAVVLKGSGAPASVAVSGCAPILIGPVEEAVRRWRWIRGRPDAPKLSGVETAAEVTVRIP